MIPVYQHLTVANDGHGNCFNACVASILELPLREVAQVLPSFAGDYWGEWCKWGEARGVEIDFRPLREGAPKGYAIATGLGGRVYPDGHHRAGQEISHAIVVFNGELIHDPFPGGKGVREVRYWWTIATVTSGDPA